MSGVLLQILIFSALLLLFAGTKHYTRHSRLPAEAWILLLGIAYGLLKKHGDFHNWPALKFDPDLILFFFLPLLIYASGRHVDVRAMRANTVAILLYAVPGVIATAFLIGLPVAWVLGIPALHGLLFGAAIGATDPIAVGSVFSRFGLNRQLDMLVEGESLFNDATTVVLFTLLFTLAIEQHSVALLDAGGKLLYAVGLAVPMGMAAGWFTSKVLAVWKEKQIFYSASIGLASALLLFMLCEYVLHCSGVIAVLVSALLSQHLSRKQVIANKPAQLDTFWSYLNDTLNSFLFFLLGVATGLHEFNLPALALLVGLSAMLCARVILIYPGAFLMRALGKPLPSHWQHVMVLGGLRGAVSAALILLIPEDYPNRDHFLCLAFFLTAFTLIVQPLIMHLYLSREQGKNNPALFPK